MKEYKKNILILFLIGLFVSSFINDNKIYTTEVTISEGGGTVKTVFHEGICDRSPNGTLWRISVDNDGILITDSIQ